MTTPTEAPLGKAEALALRLRSTALTPTEAATYRRRMWDDPRYRDGRRVVRFIERFCVATKGKFAGKRIRLRDWQVVDVLLMFELDPTTGLRLYRYGLYGLPRKNGKSMLGAGLALQGLIADGEMGAEVFSCAGDKEQAKIVFKEAARMVELNPDLQQVLRVYRDVIEHADSGSIYRALSAEAYTKEGLNPSRVVFDEVHVQPNHDLWDVMTQGSAAREQAMCLGITTAGYDKATLCGYLYDLGKRGDTLGMFFKWYEPSDPLCDHTDPRVWAETNPGLGDYLFEQDFRVRVASTPENTFRRYRLNQWTSSMEAWLPAGAWDACADLRGAPPDGTPCVLAFDGSFSNDSTALVGCTLADRHLFVVGKWERPTGPDGEGWRVPTADVEEAVREACRQWGVVEVASDPFRWQRSLQALEAEGLPIVEYNTSSPARMVPACAEFYDAVVEGRLSHDGDPDLARHIGNAMLKTDRLGPRIVKEHKGSSRKIDLAVCAVVALNRATAQGGEPAVPTLW